MAAKELQTVAIFPTRDLAVDPLQIRDYAQAAEALGFSYLLTYDHVVLGETVEGNNAYCYQHAFHEPMTLFSYISACTKKIKMMPGVLVLPQRQTALVAKQAAQIDLMSNERFELGVGVGTNATEFAAMGAIKAGEKE